MRNELRLETYPFRTIVKQGTMTMIFARGLAAILLVTAAPALAQDDEGPWRTRVTLGPALVPSYPGADDVSLAPIIEVARKRGDEPFDFEAPDQNAGFKLFGDDTFQVGPAFGFEDKRTLDDTDGLAPRVKFSFEAGGFVQYAPIEALRLRVEARKGVTGHKAFTGSVAADYVARDADRWLFSIGPRVTFSDGKYQRAYFGVPVGGLLPAYRPGGGIQAVGGATSVRFSLGGRFGVLGYAKYDRLVDDAADSPLVRAIGSRDQYSGGVALSYTFGG